MHRFVKTAVVRSSLFLAALPVAVWLTACGGGGAQYGGGSGPQYGDFPVVSSYPLGGKADYNNAFEGVNGTTMIKMFLFRSSGSGTGSSGTFDTPSNSRISYSSGSFQNLTDNFLTEGSFDLTGFRFTAAGVKYTGKFLSDDVVEVSADTGSTYVLTRNSGPQANAHVADTWTLSRPVPHLLQLGPTNGSLDEDATLQVAGTEFNDDGSTSAVTGTANVDRVELTIHRSSGDIALHGQFSRNASGYLFDKLTFTDGTDFVRGGTPDAQRAVLFAQSSSGVELRDVDLKGVQRKTLLSFGSDRYIPRFAISPDKALVAVIVQNGAQRGELSVIDRATGVITPITSMVPAGGDVLDVDWSPDGQQLAYVARPTSGLPAILYVDRRLGGAPVAIQSAKPQGTTQIGYVVRWSSTGNFLIFKGNVESADKVGLYAAKPGLAGVKTIWSSTNGDASTFAWAPSGDRIAFVSKVQSEFWTIDVANAYATNSVPLSLVSQNVVAYSWAPNSLSLAYSTGNSLNAYGAATGVRRSIASKAIHDNFYWAPDSARVAYLPSAGTGWVIWDGLTSKVLVDSGTEDCFSASSPQIGAPTLGFSPDSARVAYLTMGPSGNCRLTVVDIASSLRQTITQEVRTPQVSMPIRWLADGRRVAFVANVELGKADDGLDDLLVADRLGKIALKVSDPLLGAVSVYTNSIYTIDYEIR